MTSYNNTWIGDCIMMKFGEKLKNAQNSLFTFVIHSGVPSTNNDSENSTRKCIMQRNVRGQAKSSNGMRMLAVFLTCFETWRMSQNSLSCDIKVASRCLIHT